MTSYLDASDPNNMYHVTTAVAVPVMFETQYNNSNINGFLERNPSSYRLPASFKEHNASSPANNTSRKNNYEQLKRQGFTSGLADALSKVKETFPLRIWVLDNSGSMQKADGKRLVETSRKDQVKYITSTRWEELRECSIYHVQLAALLEAPTTFRLLNDPGASSGEQQFGVAESDTSSILMEVNQAHHILRQTSPGGVTPLTRHVLDIQQAVCAMAPDLRARGQRVAIILATDGLPTDSEGNGGLHEQSVFVQALRSLEQLPIWLVVRLCTNEESVVQFYNSLDEQLELSMEVLDDFVGEAEEVYHKNPWLNYALPLHRMREFGFPDRILDMLDERALTEGELRDFCHLLFGSDKVDGALPDPAVNWSGFLKELDRLVKQEEYQWNPITKKLAPWINVKKLHSKYGDSSKCSIQ